MNFVSRRTDNTQLPEIKEIEAILAREAKRPVALGKEKIHFASFELLIKWLELLDLPTDIFKKESGWQDVAVYGADIQARVVFGTIQLIKRDDIFVKELIQKITNYLGEEDTPQSSDSIFVFGNKSLSRIEKAVGLYNQGLAPRIFISGGAPIYEKREKSEAQVFQDWATNHDVPENAIAIHDGAITVADNVRGGLNVMDLLGLKHESLILVINWFAVRRSWAHMMKYMSDKGRLYRVNAPLAEESSLAQDNWFTNEDGIKVVFNEFVKMKISEALNSS